MNHDDFLHSYKGESTDELIAYEDKYRIDSLVLAFEQAIDQKRSSSAISKEESYILAIEALEREVNNGGYHQFFLNTSEFSPIVVDALLEVGCLKTATITQKAISALKIQGILTVDKVDAAIDKFECEELAPELGPCDDAFFQYEDDIATMLFEWIKRNRAKIRIGESIDS